MSIAQSNPQPARYQERFVGGAHFIASTKFIFPKEGPDSVERYLELHLIEPELHEDSSPLEILLVPLTVLLVEEVNETGQGKVSVYEDAFYFTHDGDFFRHGWRKGYKNRPNGSKFYHQTKYERDGDMKKLCMYGEAIREMLQGRRMDHNLEEHPTVQGLKTHTLWKHIPDPSK